MSVAIINYGLGNIKSISNALKVNGIPYFLTNKATEILRAKIVILPGVGSFPEGMRLLKEQNLIEPIKQFSQSNKPMIGICLGMQLFFESSSEFENCKGLGLIKGKVTKLLKDDTNFHQKVPNIGWRQTFKKHDQNSILEGLAFEESFYFTHSYYCQPNNDQDSVMESKFGHKSFCAAVISNNIYGFQFHPEKSSTQGLKIINNIKVLL